MRKKVCIASWARWYVQLKGLAELEKRCQNMMQEVKSSSERQEVLKGMVVDKIRLQSRATEKYYEHIFVEMKELEEKKSMEALLLVRKKHILMKYQNERDEIGKFVLCCVVLCCVVLCFFFWQVGTKEYGKMLKRIQMVASRQRRQEAAVLKDKREELREKSIRGFETSLNGRFHGAQRIVESRKKKSFARQRCLA